MRASALVALLLGSAFLFGVGCKKEEAAGSAPAGDPNSTGVAECDTYLKEYKDCFPTQGDATNALREKLKGDVQSQGKDAIKAQCIQHSDLLKKNPACAKK